MIAVGAVATAFSLLLGRDVWLGGVDWGADWRTVRALGQIVIPLGLVAFFDYLTLRSAFSAVFGMTVAPILGFALLGLTAALAYGTYVLFTSNDVKALVR